MTHLKRILIVEDDHDIARLFEHHLHRSGLRTVWTEGGLHALNAVFMHRPDLIILDLMLPELHGLEVCRQIKSDPRTQHIPVIMVTALATQEDKMRGLSSGADDYMTKPFHMPELIVRVFALLRKTGATRSDGEAERPEPTSAALETVAEPKPAAALATQSTGSALPASESAL
jgi:two-component system, OmpR family, phosphate regulon response regulator PhoB